MAGLIQSAQQTSVNPLDEDAPNLSSTGYDAEQIMVNDRKDTVEGRLEGIIAKNSPLMRQAATSGDQQAAKRGLLNSTMGVQASQAAVIDKATPIAQQDANTYYDANKTNVGALNEAGRFNAAGVQELEKIGANVAGQQAIAEQKAGFDRQLQRQQGDIELELQAGDLANRSSLLAQQGDMDSRLLEERAQIDLRLQTADGAIRAELLQRQGEIDAELTNLRGDIETQLQERQAALQQEIANNQGGIEAELIMIRNEGAKELADVEYQWRSMLQTNQSAAYFFAETSNSIGNILANPDIPVSAKSGLIAQQRTLLSDGLAVIGAIGNLDLNAVVSGNGSGTGTGGTIGTPGNTFNPGDSYFDWLNQFRLNSGITGGI